MTYLGNKKMNKVTWFLEIVFVSSFLFFIVACNSNRKQEETLKKLTLSIDSLNKQTNSKVYETKTDDVLIENKDFKILWIDRQKLVDNYSIQILQDDLSEENVSEFTKTFYNQYYQGKNLTVSVFDFDFSKDFIERYLTMNQGYHDCTGNDYVALADHMVYWLCFGNESGEYYFMQDDYSLYTSYGGKNWKKEK